MRPSAARASKIGGRGTEVGFAGDHKVSLTVGSWSSLKIRGRAELHIEVWSRWDTRGKCSSQHKSS